MMRLMVTRTQDYKKNKNTKLTKRIWSMAMLTICDAETYLQFIKDDPVRPDLFEDDVQRFNNKEGFYVFADIDVDEETGATEVNAILCAVICPFIMQDEELLRELAASKGEFINMLS